MEKITNFQDVQLPEGTKLTWETMFEAKETLLSLFYNKGFLSFNWVESNINTLEAQDKIRESIGFLEEEIFEAYELLTAPEGTVETKLKYHEETADVFHLWIEVFRFSKYDHDYLLNALKFVLIEYYGMTQEYCDKRYLGDLLDLYATNIMFGEKLASNVRRIPEMGTLEGGRHHQEYGVKTLMETIKNLNLAKNELKHKYWRVSAPNVNQDRYFQKLFTGFINYIVYLKLIGIDHTVYIQNFLKKNLINQERVEKKW